MLLKIDSELTPEEKRIIAQTHRGGFGLPDALSMARGKWIDETLYNDLQLLKNLRDMSAHPSNWVTLYNQLVKQYDDEKANQKWICKATNQSPRQIFDRLKDDFDVEKANETVAAMVSYAKSRWGNLPDLEWATHKDTLTFQIDFVRKNSKPMVTELLTEKKIVELIKNPSAAPKRLLNQYNFPEEIAFESLKMAFDTLKQLKII